MATDLVLTMPRQPVRRCLFGKPEKNDAFRRAMRETEATAAMRFKRKWNFDCINDCGVSGGDFQWKSSSESDIPDFYTRGYTQKCKRRALRPCVGKSLSFVGDSDDESCGLESRVRSESPLPFFYDAANIVDVFIGMRMPAEPVTPTPVGTELRSTQSTPDSEEEGITTEDSGVASDVSFDSPLRPSPLHRSLSQTRLTDLWPIRKRARSVSADQRQSKRERMDSL